MEKTILYLLWIDRFFKVALFVTKSVCCSTPLRSYMERCLNLIQTILRYVIHWKFFPSCHITAEVLKQYMMYICVFGIVSPAFCCLHETILPAAISCYTILSYTVFSDTQPIYFWLVLLTLTQRAKLRLSCKSNGLCHMTPMTVKCLWHHAVFV